MMERLRRVDFVYLLGCTPHAPLGDCIHDAIFENLKCAFIEMLCGRFAKDLRSEKMIHMRETVVIGERTYGATPLSTDLRSQNLWYIVHIAFRQRAIQLQKELFCEYGARCSCRSK